MLIPTVIDRTQNGERAYDIYSRLLEDRIVFLSGEIDDEKANTIIAQLLFLESKDNKKTSIFTSIHRAEFHKQGLQSWTQFIL